MELSSFDELRNGIDDACLEQSDEDLLDNQLPWVVQHEPVSILKHRIPVKPSFDDWAAAMRRQGRTLFPEPAQDTDERIRVLQQALADRSGRASLDYADTTLPQVVQQCLDSQEPFKAGRLHAYAAVWQEYMQGAAVQEQTATQVMNILQHGVPLTRVHPLDEDKCKEHNHQRKYNGVRLALQQTGMPMAAAEELLRGAEPGSVELPNRFACEEDIEFAREQIDINVQRGVLIEWPWDDLKPWIVSPLSVVRNSRGKKRLILDARYLNLFLVRWLFKYETPADAIRIMQRLRLLWTLDFTAGYHHLFVMPRDWGYLGLQFEGKVFVHAALPFGVSIAPGVFTMMAQVTMAGLRQHQEALTGMIDDSLGGATGVQEASKEMGTQMLVVTALGWLLSGQKCMRKPASEAEYLGFRFDAAAQMIFVPTEKLNRLLGDLQRLRTEWSVQLKRSIAGKLASMSLALPFSSLLVRALKFETEHENVNSVLGVEMQEFLLQHLPVLNGRPWTATVMPASTLVVDTSETATGAFMLDGAWEAAIQFNAADLQRMQEGTFSSTEREVVGIARALKEVTVAGGDS